MVLGREDSEASGSRAQRRPDFRSSCIMHHRVSPHSLPGEEVRSTSMTLISLIRMFRYALSESHVSFFYSNPSRHRDCDGSLSPCACLSVTASSVSDPGAASVTAEKHDTRNVIGINSDPITPPALHTFNRIWRNRTFLAIFLRYHTSGSSHT